MRTKLKTIKTIKNIKLFKGFKTIAFAAILAGLGAAQALLPSVQAVLTPELYGYLTMIVGVLVAALRAVSTTAIGKK